jgi:hypothetical protein
MTRRMSLRAQAQEIYRKMAAQAPTALSQPPLIPAQAGNQGDPEIPVDGCPRSALAPRRVEGDAPSPRRLGAQDLTAQVRALYEGSAVPVRELAALAGITERTIYKYARKGGWTPRYRWDTGTAERVRGWDAGETFASAKGAGGRFIARADKDKPFAAGIAATDAVRVARAAKACADAAAIGEAAQAQTRRSRCAEARLSAIDAVARAIANVARYRDSLRERVAKHSAVQNRVEGALCRIVEAQVARWEMLLNET